MSSSRDTYQLRIGILQHLHQIARLQLLRRILGEFPCIIPNLLSGNCVDLVEMGVVRLKVARLFARLPAQVTVEGILAAVLPPMNGQCGLVVEGCLACVTRIRSLVHVNALVHLEADLRRIRFCAQITFVRFLTSVTSHVQP